jgi:GR25 family glycosyltransferase involved in LPS biosynthesis
VRSVLIFLLALSALVEGALVDHIPKVEGCKSCLSIDKVDFVYMINLDERPEKYQSCIDQLCPFGIEPYRFSAVNGWKLSVDDINDLGVKYESWMRQEPGRWFPLDGSRWIDEQMHVFGRNYFRCSMPRGAIGCFLSHLSIIKDALESGYETIWVMEDDIEIHQDPHIISDLIGELDELVGSDGWDILFTDRDSKNKKGDYVECLGVATRPDYTPEDPNRAILKQVVSEKFRLVGGRYGTYSMIIRRQGLQKMWDYFTKYQMFWPIDIELIFLNDFKMYTVLEDVVGSVPGASSDNCRPRY